MTQRKWTTTAQCQWLEQRIPSFLEAQSKGNTSAFFKKTYNEWFEQNPIGEVTELEKAACNGNGQQALHKKYKATSDMSARF